MGNDVEREEEVSHLDGRAEARDRACWPARRSVGRRGLSGASDLGEPFYYGWREKLLEGGAERLAGKEERTELAELRKRVRELERTPGRKTYELEILGNGFRAWE